MFGEEQPGNLCVELRQGAPLFKPGAVVCMARVIPLVKKGKEADSSV